MCEYDDQNPHEAHRAVEGWILNRVDQGPYPYAESGDAENEHHEPENAESEEKAPRLTCILSQEQAVHKVSPKSGYYTDLGSMSANVQAACRFVSAI
jgi:hypothetical protein